jgi:hypothetical protein
VSLLIACLTATWSEAALAQVWRGGVLVAEHDDQGWLERFGEATCGRRVGRRVDGVLDRGWLFADGLNPVAELDGSGGVETYFVYGTRPVSVKVVVA